MTTLRIGTRGSPLALWQANAVARRLERRAGILSELVIIRTSGDEPPNAPSASTTGAGPTGAAGPTKAQSAPLPGESQKATFVKEIEDALVAGRVDLAVHSSKDLSAELPAGLIIGATLPREDPRDAVLLPGGGQAVSFAALRVRLGERPRFGTSSVRRAAQLSRGFPGARFVPLRGNVDTRLRKLDAGECDAGVLASAGLQRLGLAHRISFALPLEVCLPAPGQGVVAIQMRNDRPDLVALAAAINDRDAFDALIAERTVVKALGGGCQMPLGAHARIADEALTLVAVAIAADGSRVVRAEGQGARNEAAMVGQSVADALLAGGAAELLRNQVR